MEWSDIKVFLMAVRAGSYTAAARTLGVNRTTIGRRIDALERAMGHPLFEETPSGPAPTRAGQRLLEVAEAIEREMAQLAVALNLPAQDQAPIRIAASAGLSSEFLPELAAFRSECPHVAIEVLSELDPVDAVTYRRADLGIALLRGAPPKRLAGTLVGTLSQARYQLRGMGEDAPKLGWGHEIETALPGPWTTANPTGTEAESAGLMMFNSWPLMKQAVLAGMGSAILWRFVAEREPTLEMIGPAEARHDCNLWLLHRAKAPPGRSTARLMSMLHVSLAQRLAPGCV